MYTQLIKTKISQAGLKIITSVLHKLSILGQARYSKYIIDTLSLSPCLGNWAQS